MDKKPMNASSFFGYGIIGTSDGFAAQTAGLLADIDIGSIVDLDNRQIFAPFDTEIIAGIREKRDGHLYTYFVLYRYAVEQERSRLGGFYGSVVALKDCTADGFAIYNLLLELATNVKVYLDPVTRRFLVPLEEVTFLQPDSLDEVIGSIKKQEKKDFSPSAYFAPLPLHSRNSFRFIDFFQNGASSVERFFVSTDQEVLEVVRNKNGLPIKSLILDNALIEQKLEKVDTIDQEIFIKEKELESLKELHQKNRTKLAQQEKEYDEWTHQLNELNPKLQSLSQKKIDLEKELFELQQSKEILIRQQEILKVQQPFLPDIQTEENKESTKTSRAAIHSMPSHSSLRLWINGQHPLLKMLFLIVAFLSLGTLGYWTTTSFGVNNKKITKAETLSPVKKDLALLEKQVTQQYLAFDKSSQDSFLARLDTFLSSDDSKVKEKAREIQKYILTIGYTHYNQELKRTDTIPILQGQLIEEFELLKNEYDSIFVSFKQ